MDEMNGFSEPTPRNLIVTSSTARQLSGSSANGLLLTWTVDSCCGIGSTLPASRPSLPGDLISVVPGLEMTSKSCYRFLRDDVPSLRVLLNTSLHGSCILSRWSDVQTLALPAEGVDRH